MQLNRARRVFPRRSSGLVLDHENLSLQKRSFLVDPHHFEPLAAFTHQIQTAVGVLLYYRNNLGSTPHFGQTLLDRAHYAEMPMLSQALANHFFVARFENVQGQGSAGEQDDIKRKQG